MQLNASDRRLTETLQRALADCGPGPVGLAVSGGSDSMAMLYLAAAVARETGLGIHVVTVNHGLRPEAADEAAFVADVCASLDLPHRTLIWEKGPASGNLQAQARDARYRLMADWATSQGISTIALAHTRDDQAETFLMRLARQAGVDGLSGMALRRAAFGTTWLRPLLSVGRQELRQYLTVHGHKWCDDPSNEDRSYDRIKARDALAALAPLGIDAGVLSGVTDHMAQARQALNVQTLAAARDCTTIAAGDVLIRRAPFQGLPPEIQRRLLVHALKWVSGAEYGPRATKVFDCLTSLMEGRQATLHGCLLLTDAQGVRVTREYNAVADTVATPPQFWDGRWQVVSNDIKGIEVRALGPDGLLQCPDWRETGVPRTSLLASPSLWDGPTLIAAPMAGLGAKGCVKVAQGDDSFYQTIISD